MPKPRASTGKARPIRGKQESFTARITPETRAALEQAAEAAGHSMSSEMELLLQSALRARKSAANEIDSLFELSWAAARRLIEENEGCGPSQSAAVYFGIAEALHSMISRLPLPEHDERFAEVRRLDARIAAARGAADAEAKGGRGHSGRKLLLDDEDEPSLSSLKAERDGKLAALISSVQQTRDKARHDLSEALGVRPA